MRMKFGFILVIVIVIFGFFAETIFGLSDRHEPLPFSAPEYELEDLTAELHSEGTIIFVSGKIRNLSLAPVRGYVIVYLLSGSGCVIHSVEVDVNDRNPFSHGQVGYFETYENIEDFPGIEDVSIEFVNQ